MWSIINVHIKNLKYSKLITIDEDQHSQVIEVLTFLWNCWRLTTVLSLSKGWDSLNVNSWYFAEVSNILQVDKLMIYYVLINVDLDQLRYENSVRPENFNFEFW